MTALCLSSNELDSYPKRKINKPPTGGAYFHYLMNASVPYQSFKIQTALWNDSLYL